MMDAVFDTCVQILVTLAEWTGLTYKEINVWIFVILWPLITLALAAWIMIRQFQIRNPARDPRKKANASGKAGGR